MAVEAAGDMGHSVTDRVGGAMVAVADRLPRLVFIPLFDVLLAAAGWTLVFTARFDFDLPGDHVERLLVSIAVVSIVQALANAAFGLSRSMWSTSGMGDIVRIVKAITVAALVYVPVLFFAYGNGGIPRSAFVLGPAVICLLYGGARALYRLIAGRYRRLRRGAPTPILAIADEASLKELARDLASEDGVRPLGLLCTSDAFRNRSVVGIPVLGTVEDLDATLASTDAAAVIVGLGDPDAEVARRVARVCTDREKDLYLVAPHSTRLPGNSIVSRLRGLQLEDLLERSVQRVIEGSSVRQALRGRRVMVTGGGGSIGFELVRQIASYGPARIIVFDQSEYNVYRALERLEDEAPHVDVRVVLGDVAEVGLVESAFQEHRPDVVFHAAAYKHVPILEDQQRAAVRTNVMGTLAVANVAASHGVESFVLISSDKAVHPSSVMGSTKRVAEMIVSAINKSSATDFMSVRFGNVLDSSGSVVPKFTEQIERGGPVTVTHPDITRYFMTIPEACELILQGLVVGQSDDILVLDMGEPIKIMDLARQMVHLAGRSRGEVQIEVTGLRPGEKLHEELFYADEALLPTVHDKIMRAGHQSVDRIWLAAVIDLLAAGVEQDDIPDVRALLRGEIDVDLTHASPLALVPGAVGSRERSIDRAPALPSKASSRLSL